MEFEKLDLKHKEMFEKYNHIGDPLSSVGSFTAHYMWKDGLDTEIYDSGSVLYMRRVEPPIVGFLPPLALDDDDLPEAIEAMANYAETHGYPRTIIDAEQWFLDKLKNYEIAHTFTEDPDNSEYLYSAEKLRTLSGKKFHSKKNHYNRFVKNQNYDVRPLKGHTEAALNMARRWLEGRESPYTKGELIGIDLAFQNIDILPITGITVFVDGVCQAFTVCEDITDKAVLVHTEKANDDIPGLFTFVNSENQKVNHPHAEIVNREQDLGIEGLRKAKKSWRPIGMVDKFIINF